MISRPPSAACQSKVSRDARLRLLEAALSGTYEGSAVFMDGQIRKAIDKELKTPPAKVPEGLSAELRPYQERGYSWLMHNIRARMGSIIADDMGLGKTVQVIAALEALRARESFRRPPRSLRCQPRSSSTGHASSNASRLS